MRARFANNCQGGNQRFCTCMYMSRQVGEDGGWRIKLSVFIDAKTLVSWCRGVAKGHCGGPPPYSHDPTRWQTPRRTLAVKDVDGRRR